MSRSGARGATLVQKRDILKDTLWSTVPGSEIFLSGPLKLGPFDGPRNMPDGTSRLAGVPSRQWGGVYWPDKFSLNGHHTTHFGGPNPFLTHAHVDLGKLDLRLSLRT